jgi:LysR family transcriptional regulator of gallate degradation
MALLRGLLVESDMVSVLSRHQIHYDEKNGILAALPFELSETRRPIGITRRDHSSMPPAAELLVNELMAVSKEVEPSL